LVFDDKTTGSYISGYTMNQWDLKSQMTGYCWLLRKAGFNARGVIISLASIPKSKKFKFDRMESDRSEFMIDNWYWDVLNTVERMKSFYLTIMQERKDKTVPEAAPFADLQDSCYAFGRSCWYLPACTDKGGEKVRLTGVEQNIWLPHKTARVSLKEYLDIELQVNPEEYVWSRRKVVNVLSEFDLAQSY